MSRLIVEAQEYPRNTKQREFLKGPNFIFPPCQKLIHHGIYTLYILISFATLLQYATKTNPVQLKSFLGKKDTSYTEKMLLEMSFRNRQGKYSFQEE